MLRNRYTSPVVLKRINDDSHNFKPLPRPTGEYPYRLNIVRVLGSKAAALQERMGFQMVGDTGSARHSDFQALVASSLAAQIAPEACQSAKPAFLYHLGDIVYNHGEASAYPAQFLTPYAAYDAPIFAIAGNHDGDINPASTLPYGSLDAFMEVFCSDREKTITFCDKGKRLSMIQPHVYWTLETPLVRFIGLYANVNKHGLITEEQRSWFIEELRYAEHHCEEQAVVVCLHHAPYSADTNHGSSLSMIDFLEDSFVEAGMRPDAVFSGHVHNYQRFSKRYKDGTTVPFIVAGAGGYADLHALAQTDNVNVEALPVGDEVVLEAYCDTCFGFLKMEVEKNGDRLTMVGEYYTLPQKFQKSGEMKASLYDRFVIPIKRDAYSTGVW